MEQLYKCYKCKEHQPAENFHKGNGRTPRNQVAAYCKKCIAAYGKTWSKENPEKRRASYARNKQRPEIKLKHLLRSTTVDRTELDFDWAWARLSKNNFRCEITGIPFTWGPKDPTTLSIDRINPVVGYTKENVRFVCWWINAAMGNWGLDKTKKLISEWQSNDYK